MTQTRDWHLAAKFPNPQSRLVRYQHLEHRDPVCGSLITEGLKARLLISYGRDSSAWNPMARVGIIRHTHTEPTARGFLLVDRTCRYVEVHPKITIGV